MTTKTIKAILSGHCVICEVDDMGHGSNPGDNYSHAMCVISRRGDRYRCYVHCSWGSDQGYYQEGGNFTAVGRGYSQKEAIGECKAELAGSDRLSFAAKNSLLKANDAADEYALDTASNNV